MTIQNSILLMSYIILIKLWVTDIIYKFCGLNFTKKECSSKMFGTVTENLKKFANVSNFNKTYFVSPYWLRDRTIFPCFTFKNLVYLSVKCISDITEWLIHCNTDSCCEHINVDDNIYLCVSPWVPACAVCVFVRVCDIKSECLQKPWPCHLWKNYDKLDALLHKTYVKVLLVLRYQHSTSAGHWYHYIK